MKKLVPDPPETQSLHDVTTLLKLANKAILHALKEGVSQQDLLKTLKATGIATFGCHDGWQRPLFAVREGVNAEDALVHVSLLLQCAEQTADEISEQASGVERGLIGATIHSIEMARAVVDALLDGRRASV
ncbi:DUF3077 domain-containing protein [Pseudomonas sp. LS1212]|uniref:DUF3077 domain-containing protein n=1 Tax=Pseudomonas sp. LS1212 TaxID=2972478 RepID=UPI00215D1F7D|nr:DUF3077 domain-containing protein [Pseudomonas sp. LS1212]UVJ44595.1 DUF3077 domain-containing protein [Pseudomonas sp. LS1212]